MYNYQLQFLVVVLAGWINRHQQDVIEYLKEEYRIVCSDGTDCRDRAGQRR